MKSDLLYLFLALLVLLVGIGSYLLQEAFGPVINTTDNSPEEFCGYSTFGSCVSDSECIPGGCSAQVCLSRSEEPIMTTCEDKVCYESEKYNLTCNCVQGKCQWN